MMMQIFLKRISYQVAANNQGTVGDAAVDFGRNGFADETHTSDVTFRDPVEN